MTHEEVCALLNCAPATAAFTCDSVTEDSRKVRAGSVFVAAPGARHDGHDFAEAAVRQGAVAVLGGREGVDAIAGAPYLRVEHPRSAAGVLAHALAGNPSRQMTVVGITGTNGKSSTACLAQSIFRAAGHTAGNFGTMGYDVGGRTIPAPHTTPFGEELAAIFLQAREAGVTHVAMEVSSHALAQDRVAGVKFEAAAFTNLTQDHLDYHLDMERYRMAKLRLFALVAPPTGVSVVNADDASAEFFVSAARTRCYTYGREGDVRASGIEPGFDGSRFRLITPWGEAPVHLRLLGRHNVWNALCAAAVCGGLGTRIETVAAGLGALPAVPGRFEPVFAGQDFHVIVDYAHTDDGLQNVLSAARELCAGRVITLFGCGGDRDRGKRPKMGAVAGRMSDFAVLTSDNPRTEDPLRILDDVEPGLRGAGKERDRDYLVIPDRRLAITRAVALARSGDLVMIAGKGHEDYQILGTEKIHFDDREVAAEALHALLRKKG